MTFVAKRVFFNTGTGIATSTVTVAHGLGVAPSAIVVTWNGRTESVDTAGLATLQKGIGFATSASARRCIGGMSVHNQAAPRVSKGMRRDDAVVCAITAAGASDGLLDVQSFDATNVVFVVDVAFTTDQRVQMLAIGGTDVLGTAVGTLTEPGSTGVQNTTGLSLGGTPSNNRSVLLLLGGSQVTTLNAVYADSVVSIGAATSTSQMGLASGGSNDANAASTSCQRYSWDTECFAQQNATVGGPTARAAFSGWLSDGFALNWLEVSGVSNVDFYLVINGPSIAVVKHATATATGSLTPITGLGFSPSGALLFSYSRALASQDSVTTHDKMSLGMWDGAASQGCMGWWDQNAVATSAVCTAIEHDSVFIAQTAAGAVDGIMTLVSVDADGMTYTMTDGDGTNAAGDVFDVVFGPTPAASDAQWAHGAWCSSVRTFIPRARDNVWVEPGSARSDTPYSDTREA